MALQLSDYLIKDPIYGEYEDYDEMEFECNYDSIPYKPKYLTKNILYKLRGSKNNDTGEDA